MLIELLETELELNSASLYQGSIRCTWNFQSVSYVLFFKSTSSSQRRIIYQ